MKTLLSLICLLLPLPVMAQDVALEPITAENADQIEQINMIGYGLVDDMAYTPDGEQIVLAGSLGLAFYDADLYERAPADRWTLPEPRVLALAFSSDGSLLATISGDRLWARDATVTMRLWNPATREVYSEWTMPWMSSPYMIFSPDNSELAFYEWSFSRKGDDVLHWDVSDPANVIELEPEQWSSIQQRWYASHSDLWTSGSEITYSPDGNTIAFVTSDGVTAIDAMTLEERYTVQKDEYYGVDELLISPDSSLLIGIASAEWSTGLIDVWDLATGEKLLEWTHGGPNSFALHPTEPALMFKRYDGSEIHYWRLGTDTSEAVFSDDSAWWRNDYTDIDFNNDGSILAAVHSGVVEFWDVLQGVKVREDLYIEQSEYTETVGFNRVVFSPDGDLLAVEGSALDGVSGGSYIHLWDMKASEFVGHIAYDDRLQDFAFSADGTIIATYHIRDEFKPAPIVINFWDVASVLESRDIIQPVASIWTANWGPGHLIDLTFSADGQYIAFTGVGQGPESIEIWEIATVLQKRVVGSYLKFDRIGRVATYSGLGPIAFSPDSNVVVSNTIGTDCYLTYAIIPTEELNCLGSFPDSNVPRAITFLNDDIVVSGAEDDWRSLENVSTDVRIWDANTRELLTELEGHFENYNDIAVSPDGRIIVSAGGGYSCSECPPFDGALRVWGIPAGD